MFDVFEKGSGPQCAVQKPRMLSMNRTPSPHPSPPLGERVPEGRVRGILRGSWSQCAVAEPWRLSMNRSSESGRGLRGLPHSKTQARATCVRSSARSWTAPVLWRFGFRCKNGLMVPMRVQSWRLKLSMNRNVAQVFQPAGLGDFPVAQWNGGLQSPPNPQSGKTALQGSAGSWSRYGIIKSWRLP